MPPTKWSSKRDREPWPSCGFTLPDGTECQTVSVEREGGPCSFHARLADQAEVLADPPTPKAPAGGVRKRLAHDVSQRYDLVVGAVFDAMSAETSQPTRCPKCSHRFEVRTADHGARLRAAETALREGFGRPSDAAQVAAPVAESWPVEQLDDLTLTRFGGHVV